MWNHSMAACRFLTNLLCRLDVCSARATCSQRALGKALARKVGETTGGWQERSKVSSLLADRAASISPHKWHRPNYLEAGFATRSTAPMNSEAVWLLSSRVDVGALSEVFDVHM
mmetsp:Transcript_33162/g.60809  ORF Transcript_33162/g.60809 Transcript_33162/m.60809 type:complete len:114 (+) Transcript_33162:626-967(+)